VSERTRVEEGSRVDLSSLVGRPVELIGVLTRSKIPTVCGVDVEEDDELSDQLVVVRGVLARREVQPRAPGAPIVASRGPGVYYSLRTPEGRLARPARWDQGKTSAED
jgi:hypothetical protein